MIVRRFLLAAIAALALASPSYAQTKYAPAPKAATPAAAQIWRVDPRASEIAFSGAHAGAPFRGTFQTWSADIRFDPANLAGSSARVTIQTASARTSDATQTATLKEGEWFGARQFPTATFQSTSFRALGQDRYEAAGALTLKNRATPVTLPFTLRINGNRADMTGALVLDRVALNLGMTSDPRAEWVSRSIQLSLRVRATKAAR